MKMRYLGILLFFRQMLFLYACNAAELPMPQDRKSSTIKADVALVPVDVTVRNKEGGFIGNLQAKDFVVYDNGVAQKIDLFSYDEMPLDVALVVDGGNWNHALELQKAALTVLQQLNPKQDRVALFCTGWWMYGYAYQLTGLTQDRFLIEHQLEKILSLSGSSIKDGLWEAALYLRSKGGPHRRRAIILISDNYERFPSFHSYKETIDEMLEAGAILYSIQIPPFHGVEEGSLPFGDFKPELENTLGPAEAALWKWWYGDYSVPQTLWEKEFGIPGVAFGSRVIIEYLRVRRLIWKGYPYWVNALANPTEVALLAGETGGEVLNASSASDLPNAMNAAILNLQHSYTLGFYPSDRGTEGTYHALKVEADAHADYSIRARKGYYIHASAASTIDQGGQESDGHSQNTNSNNQYLSAMERLNFNSRMTRPNRFPQGLRDMDSFAGSYLTERYLIHENLDWKKGKPSRIASKYGLKHLDFTAVVKNYSNPEVEANTKIDLRVNAAQLFFDFFDSQYRAFLYVCILQGNNPVGKVMTYLVSYPEEGFKQAIQSNISLSITTQLPKLKNIRILIFQHESPLPPYGSYGIQSVQNQP
jgi:VWFA-related protein